MTTTKLNIITGLLFLGLLTTLLIKLTTVPGGMILSGLFLGIMFLVGLLMVAFILTTLLRTFSNKYSFLTIFSTISSIFILGYHYCLYSPTLKIIVPKGFRGEVALVLSNVDENILNIDSHGIGYINKSTFNKIYSRPDVFETDGTNLNELCVPYNNYSFWANGKSSSNQTLADIQTLSFKILPPDKYDQRHNYTVDLFKYTDTNKIYKDK